MRKGQLINMTEAGFGILFLLLLTACTLPVQVDDTRSKATSVAKNQNQTTNTTPPAMAGMMDMTKGTYGTGREEGLILVTVENEVHRQLMLGKPELSGMTDEEKLPAPYLAFLTRLKEQYGLKRVADWPLRSIGVRCLVFQTDGSQSRDQVVSSLSSEDSVETAEKVQIFDVLQQPYNDPYLPLQHGFKSIQAEYSHRWTTGKGVTVAVIDTGLDSSHPDLQQSLSGSSNFVDNNEADFQADVHGTGVAGVIAAAANNDTGMVGVAPAAKILALKACWKNDKGTNGASCNSFTLAKALDMAIRKEVDIINLSLAGPRDKLLERLTTTALQNNIIVVGAQDPDNKTLFPAAVKGIIAVGLPGDETATTVWAPGTKVLSTAPGKHYEFYTGSSFSTAHISGLVALIRQLQPDWSPAQVRSLLFNSNEPGSGAVNACRAIATLVAGSESLCIDAGT